MSGVGSFFVGKGGYGDQRHHYAVERRVQRGSTCVGRSDVGYEAKTMGCPGRLTVVETRRKKDESPRQDSGSS